ncbi:hypothetical protein ACFPFP_30545 [Bradyrhizobium sp. GCM10023182]|uniref:Bacterial virulence protein VirB8 domain-containing protein n=1 Tax=Bradyrhizobium zhengyangense TaxID=2911009 RepID=A0ABS9LW80_9BRAD|nr:MULTISPECIES: hypothetical protein [Bradyrhizobium]MCG2671279.1 hypothetical protein [Bradyrhizobium zhengyangense]
MCKQQKAEAQLAGQKRQEAIPAAVADTSAEPDLTWDVLGLRVGRKTEIIALVAFMLSLGGVLWQVFNFARGAVVQLFPSDQIVLTTVEKLGKNYRSQDNNLALIATMAYSNEGDVGHNAIVRREYITMTFGDRTVEHRWYEFGSSDLKDGALEFKRDSEARPFPVNAASAVSHETLFAAWEVDCGEGDKKCDPRGNFVQWDDFLAAAKANHKLVITTKAIVYPSTELTASCEIKLRQWEIDVLQTDQWLSATCSQPGAPAVLRVPLQGKSAK